VIDYETFCKIHDCHDRQGMTIAQTARALGLDPRTVATWVARPRFEPRRSRPRGSVLDPFKPRITRLLDTTRIALSRSSSVCARKDTAVA
jgi:transposase